MQPKFVSSDTYLSQHPVVCQLEQVQWVNYYHLKDPISDHLDYYEKLDNVELTYPASWGDQGHQGYWTNKNFYQDIGDRFLY